MPIGCFNSFKPKIIINTTTQIQLPNAVIYTTSDYTQTNTFINGGTASSFSISISNSNSLFTLTYGTNLYYGNTNIAANTTGSFVSRNNSRENRLNYKGNIMVTDNFRYTFSPTREINTAAGSHSAGIEESENIINDRFICASPTANRIILIDASGSSPTVIDLSQNQTNESLVMTTSPQPVGLKSIFSIGASIDGRMLGFIANSSNNSIDGDPAVLRVFKLVNNTTISGMYNRYVNIQTSLTSTVLARLSSGLTYKSVGPTARGLKFSKCGSYFCFVPRIVVDGGLLNYMFIFLYNSELGSYYAYARIALGYGVNQDFYASSLTEDGELYYYPFILSSTTTVKKINLHAAPFNLHTLLDVPDPDSSFLVYTLNSTTKTTTANTNGLTMNTCIIKLELNLRNSMAGVLYSSVGSSSTSNALVIYIHGGILYAEAGVRSPSITRTMSWTIPNDTLTKYKIYISFSLNNTYDVQKMIVNKELKQHIKTVLANNVALSSVGTGTLGSAASGLTLVGSNIALTESIISEMNPVMTLYSHSNVPLCL